VCVPEGRVPLASQGLHAASNGWHRDPGPKGHRLCTGLFGKAKPPSVAQVISSHSCEFYKP